MVICATLLTTDTVQALASFLLLIALITTVPSLIPLTLPLASTVAISRLDDTYVNGSEESAGVLLTLRSKDSPI